MIGYDTVQYDKLWHSTIWWVMTEYSMIGYDTVSMISYDRVQYDRLWHSTV